MNFFLHVPSRAPYQFVCDCGKGFVTLRFNDLVKMLAQRKLIIIFIRFLYKGHIENTGTCARLFALDWLIA